jgi:hypothetical protein
MIGHLRRLDEAGVAELLRHGVIGAELADFVVAEEVEARVADVRHHRFVVEHQEHGEGAAHACVVFVGLRLFVDRLSGLLDDLARQDRERLVVDLAAAHFGQLGVPAADLAGEDLDGRGRRDLARSVAAHAVADDVETALVVDVEAVLVLVAISTDVGEAHPNRVHVPMATTAATVRHYAGKPGRDVLNSSP